ncbi:MAG: DUF45 domain-containing protein [Thermomicrobiales bacterium]|nr:DUF45 domain-containing protein [Thermomicrobiales bacterium]
MLIRNPYYSWRLLGTERSAKRDDALVHEMDHLLGRRDDDAFRNLVDQHAPNCRLHRDLLHQMPSAARTGRTGEMSAASSRFAGSK